MKILIPIGKSKNAIATIAIGGNYYDEWFENSFPSWERYCKKNDLGLIVFDEDLISKDDWTWKKATWQKMLIGDYLNSQSIDVLNICYLDTDILINHHAPNIFNYYDTKTIGLVSLINDMPYTYNRAEINRRISFLRHTHYSSQYPLDSSIHMSIKGLFEYHNLPFKNDFACMGLIVFNVNNHAGIMKEWFCKYDKNIQSITGGGDQTHINFEIQDWGKVTWLNYKFQALWIYEMSMKYPFLYSYGKSDYELIKECVEASLMGNYFLHFAGSLYESDMWKNGDVFSSTKKQNELDCYYDYLSKTMTGIPKGTVKLPR